ncbi:expansin-A17 [Lolium perenne]|uniref:expansin-A17 n=1 Tax=Lolium perenne TaxID=4522 RepID=UPI0021EB08B7|nr:expansin-A17-like [Lolium perenne]
MERIPAIVVVVLIAAAAQLASAGFPNQYWPAPAPATPAPSGPSTGFPTSGWQDAHATFYGDDSGLGHDFGGACGYSGENIAGLYSTRTAALSTPLFQDGLGCGRCYEIRCVQSKWCVAGSPSVVVTGTNLCPPNWYQASDNGGWCNPPRQHFDMAPPSFYKLAARVAGIVPIQYRRVPCQRSGGVRFYVAGNDYWLLLYVMNLGGAGDVSTVSIRPADSSNWIDASQNWGITYQAFTRLEKSVGLVVRLTTGSSPQKTIVCGDAIPAYWASGLTYQGSSNFW